MVKSSGGLSSSWPTVVYLIPNSSILKPVLQGQDVVAIVFNALFEASSNRERELLQQVAELQCRVEELVNELQRLKMRNAQLERQLNAVFKREEERMNNKETAHDLG
eukprot:Gb_18423 [translate_table: standard]